MVFMDVQYGLYGCPVWSLWMSSMVFMDVQYGLYGCPVWSLWMSSMVFMDVQYGLYGCPVWSLWMSSMVFMDVQYEYGLYGCPVWSLWMSSMVFMDVQYGLYGCPVWSLWMSSMVFMDVQYGLYGCPVWSLWMSSMVFMDVQYGLYGCPVWSLWMSSMVFMDVQYGLYGCPAWSLTTNKNLDTIRTLQKICPRIMNFAEYNSHTNPLLVENSHIKLDDVVESSHLNLVFDYIQGKLPDDLNNLFPPTDNIHSHHTRTVDNKGLFIPSISTTNYGNKSLRFAAPISWNNFVKSNPEILSIKHKAQLKKIVNKKHKSIYMNPLS